MLKKVEKSIFLTKPIIGISITNTKIIKAIILCNAIPIILSNDIQKLKTCNGIIILDDNINNKKIVKYAIKNNIPILGIYKGMHLMTSINNNVIKNNNKTNFYIHKIKTKDNSIIGKIIGNCYINSNHDEYINNSGIYKVTAKSNVIEAIEYPKNKFNVGVQWHPEDLIYYDEKQLNLFKEFIKASISSI